MIPFLLAAADPLSLRGLVTVIIVLAVIGAIVTMISKIEMMKPFQTAIYIVAVCGVALWLLNYFAAYL